MPSLVRTKCPNCNAPLKIDPGAEQVTCEFCHNTALLTHKGQEPRRSAATMHFKTIDIDSAQAHVRKVIIGVVVGAAVLPILGVVTCVVASLGSAVKISQTFGGGEVVVQGGKSPLPGNLKINTGGKVPAHVQTQLDDQLRKAMSQVNKALAQAGMGGVNTRTTGIRVTAPDLTKVDGLELMKQARTLAQRVDAHAVLSSMHFPKLVGGTVDVAGGARAYFTFGYKYRDTSKPPGADTVQGRVSVSLHQGAFTTVSIPSHDRPIPEPGCGTTALWTAAVQSGVPDNAVAALHYRRRGFRGSATVWSLSVDGHTELTRTFDGKTCQLRSR